MQALIDKVITTPKKEEAVSFLKNLPKFIFVTIELGLLFLVIHAFRIQREHGLLQILIPLFCGFIIYHLLPRRFQLPFFTLLSISIFLIVLGLKNGFLLLGMGSALIGLCHLPIRHSWRTALVVSAGILLAAVRTNWLPVSWGRIVPVLASMFMFRIILYLYEIRQKTPPPATIWHRITYFFLFPNVCFPFFPIVDYKTFVRNYFNEDTHTIIQKGIKWMTLGVSQLLLYRIIYTYYSIDPAQVTDAKSLAVYLATSYAIILKLSGQAHFVVGMLCLFGFNLPAVFNYYFLATGPSEYWRRINVYWRDFTMKVFYYPIYFRFKKLGLRTATILSLIFVFVATAILHSYQFFWLMGTFRLTLIDGIFWGVLGLLIIYTSLRQMSAKRSMGKSAWTFKDGLKTSAQVISFGVFMCILWSIWRSSSFSEWKSMMAFFTHITVKGMVVVLLAFIGAVILGALIQLAALPLQESRFWNRKTFYETGLLLMLFLSAILILRGNKYYTEKDSKLSLFIASIKTDKLSAEDADNQERGYYENIMNSNRLSVESFSVGNLKPLDWVELGETKAVRMTDDLLLYEPLPNARIKFKNQKLTMNEWGMRDKPYAQQKPADTYRFALLGSSYEMGSGVADGEDFESLAEDLLNHNGRFEILNFGVSGYGLVRDVKVAETKVFPFEPDAVIYVAHTREIERCATGFLRILEAGADPEYDALKSIVRESGYRRDMGFVEAKRALLPYSERIMQWGYERIAEISRRNGAIPVLVFLPTLEGGTDPAETRKVLNAGRQLGFVTIDLSEVYGERNLEDLQCAPWDNHPGKKAQKLIADLLYKKLVENSKSLGFPAVAAGATN